LPYPECCADSEYEAQFDAFVIACHCDPISTFVKKSQLSRGWHWRSIDENGSMLGHRFSYYPLHPTRFLTNKLCASYGLDSSLASVRAPKTSAHDLEDGALFLQLAEKLARGWR
jgi:hypothetical protein